MKGVDKTAIQICASMGETVSNIALEYNVTKDEVIAILEEAKSKQEKNNAPMEEEDIEDEEKEEETREEKLMDLLNTQRNITLAIDESPETIRSKYKTYLHLVREITMLETIEYVDGTPMLRPGASDSLKTLDKLTKILGTTREVEWMLHDIDKAVGDEEEDLSLESFVTTEEELSTKEGDSNEKR